MRGQCAARPTVTFPAAEHHRPLAGTKLYCLVTEAHGCEQLSQRRYPAMRWPGVEPATSRLQMQRHITTTLPSHLEDTYAQLADIDFSRPQGDNDLRP